ncbi:glycosyltransferase family 25 protein [Phenylobacterium sp. LjRoot219]|uniref:glycosyltransferase family 25 protein n=1 Tax=Phenylobacterium sp. LjRoot219 TaxID=3342283 RepID=UPI003ECCECE9
MRASYINLDEATARRAGLEASFAAAPHDGWTLTRFPAVTAAEMAQAPGALSAREKACFESHRRLIGQHLDDAAPLMVLEDDAAFSSVVFRYLDHLLAAPADWDLLFTDVALPQADVMVSMARAWGPLKQAQELRLMPLAGTAFSAATAYLVRGTSKARLHALLSDAAPLDTPYDLRLRQLVAAGELKALACFPFLTTLAAAADASQIRHDDEVHQRVADTFRRLMFIERDLAASRPAVAAIRVEADEVEQLLGGLLGAMTRPLPGR